MRFEQGNQFGRRWQPGQSGNPRGRPPRKAAVEAMFDLIDETNGSRAIAQVWLSRMLAGDYPFFKEYLDRCDGKVR